MRPFRIVTVKAARYSSHGGPEVIKIEEIADPTPESSQVFVENYAASINPFDYKVRSGMIPGMPSEFPLTIGGDFSGRIVSVGDKVTEFTVGDEIYGQASVFGGASGSIAENLVANPGSIYLKPENTDFYEAASLPLVGASAIQAIEDHIHLKKGQKILIQGGSGGIGSIAIQIAKKIGAYIVTTVSTDNVEFAKSLGADRIIDYKKEDFSEILTDLDAVFDASGKKLDERSFKIVRSGAIIVSMTSVPKELGSNTKEISVISQNSQVTSDRLKRLKKYVEENDVKPQIDRRFQLDDASDAYRYHEQDHPRGKVVIKIR